MRFTARASPLFQSPAAPPDRSADGGAGSSGATDRASSSAGACRLPCTPPRTAPSRCDGRRRPAEPRRDPSRDPSARDHRLRDRRLALAEPCAPPRSRPIGEPGDAVGVEAMNPVTKRLAIPARGLGRRLPAPAGERVGDRRQARRHTSLGLEPCVSPKLADLDVRSDDQPVLHDTVLPGGPENRLRVLMGIPTSRKFTRWVSFPPRPPSRPHPATPRR